MKIHQLMKNSNKYLIYCYFIAILIFLIVISEYFIFKFSKEKVITGYRLNSMYEILGCKIPDEVDKVMFYRKDYDESDFSVVFIKFKLSLGIYFNQFDSLSKPRIVLKSVNFEPLLDDHPKWWTFSTKKAYYRGGKINHTWYYQGECVFRYIVVTYGNIEE